MSLNEHNFPVGDPDPVIIKIKIGGGVGGGGNMSQSATGRTKRPQERRPCDEL
jgi:hypothetical protein